MPLAPPPDGAVFPTWAECFQAVQSIAASEGYAVNSKGQAKSKDTGLYRRYVIRCDKSGTFKSAAQIGIRRMSTKKTDCPFSAACNIRPDGCYLRVLVPGHNHPPSAVPAAHIQHRKLTDEQRQLVEARAIERKSVKLIWEELKTLDPTTYITFKDVDNAVQRFRKKAKDGATGVQAIMYKLVERQDLFCFTLERDGGLQGAFWVPRWSTDLWMRPNGTPDILVMLADHIANRPVLSILEMNSVLNTAGFGGAPPGRALPNDPVNPNPNANSIPASSPENLVVGNNSNNDDISVLDPALQAESIPNTQGMQGAQNAQNAQNVQNDAGMIGDGLDPSLGAGYAILPDKSNATILWLRSAVEMLRQRIPHCPKPRFLTLTDFQTAEKNILVEVSKGGTQHRQMHIVFGQVLSSDDENPAHHGLRTRKQRTDKGPGQGADGATEDDGDGEIGEQLDGEGEQEGVEGVIGVEEGDGDGLDADNSPEDQDMDGDHDSDADIVRQLTSGHMQNERDRQQDSYDAQIQTPGHGYNNNPAAQAQRSLGYAQPSPYPHIPTPGGMPSNHPPLPLPLPAPAPASASASAPRHPSSAQAPQPPAHMGYSPMMGGVPQAGANNNNNNNKNMTPRHPPRPM